MYTVRDGRDVRSSALGLQGEDLAEIDDPRASLDRCRILFVNTAPNHSSALRRIRVLTEEGAFVSSCVELIDKSKTGYIRRIPSMLLLGIRLLLKRDHDIVWAWGLDAALVGAIANLLRRRKLVWDISDLLPVQTQKNARWYHLLNIIEQLLIGRVDLLILTSPKFYEHYYDRIFSEEKTIVIENLLDLKLDNPRSVGCRLDFESHRTRVCYAGIFRSDKLLRLVIDAAKLQQETVEFHLHGIFSREIANDTIQLICKADNIFFHGSYKDPFELENIYKNADIIFGLLDLEADINEHILLPNRFYHSGLFGIPIICTSGSFTGDIAKREKLGIVTANTVSGFCEALETLRTPAARLQIRAEMPPVHRFLSGTEYNGVLATLGF